MQKENFSQDDLMRLVNQQQQEQVAKDIIESHIKILSASYDKAVTYTNVIVIGGYASFFGLWSVSKPYLSAVQARWAALIMLLSVSTFVFFEVYKMVVMYRSRFLGQGCCRIGPDLQGALVGDRRSYANCVRRVFVTTQ